MAYNSAPGRAEYAASAAQTVFPFSFKIYSTSDIKVYQTPSGQVADDATDILIETIDYTVTINGDLGGDVTLLVGASANDAITLLRELPIDRPIEYQQSGDLLASTLNTDQDYQTYLIADKEDDGARHLTLGDAIQGVSTLVPNPEALKLLGWSSGEDKLENFTIGDDTVFINIYNADSIADLLLVDPAIYETVNVRGYYTPNDGGGGIFNYDVTQSAINNNGTVINGWVRQNRTQMSLLMFGVATNLIKDFPTITSGLTDGDSIYMDGYNSESDGGEGLFIYDASLSATNNSGTIIDGWVRQYDGAINVKWFGAVGDDATNDTVSFTNAVGAMGINSSLYVPGGIYLVQSTLNFKNNGTSIHGDGVDASIIKRTTDGGDILLIARETPSTTQLAGFTISDLTLYTAFDATTGAALHIKNITRFNLRNVFIRNGKDGMVIEGIRDSRIDGLEIIMGEFFTVARNGSHLVIDEPADASKVSTETFFSNFNFTTAGNTDDVRYALTITGSLDGIWFNNGHMFGGSLAGCLIDGASCTQMSGLTFEHVWFDQFTVRNLAIQGAAVEKFRLLTFNDCRFWGGSTNNISLDSGSNIQDVTFNSCEIGVTLGDGVQVGAGQVTIKNTSFKGLAQGLGANSYAAATVTTPAVGTTLTVTGCDFDMTRLYYGVRCINTTMEYNLLNNLFYGDFAVSVGDIYLNASALVGTCEGNKTQDATAGDVAAAATLKNQNIATDEYNITGVTANIDTIEPKWHGRTVTFKADTANQNLVSGGNIRNKLNAASSTITAADVAIYQFRADSNRWHEL